MRRPGYGLCHARQTQPTSEHGPAETAGGRIGLVAVRSHSLDVDEVLASVQDPAAGGQVVFVGTVRDHDGGREVSELRYEAHPSALDRLHAVVAATAARPGVVVAAAVHRTGPLRVGDLAVVTAVSAAHRGAAFAACEWLIDELKHTVPIWKEQVFADGTSEGGRTVKAAVVAVT